MMDCAIAHDRPNRPALRYHGGKWILAPWIVSHFPPHRVYVEPFGGAASVLLSKTRSYAEVYNDLDDEIVNVFRVLRDQGDELIRLLSLTPFSRKEFELSYSHTDEPVERARRTITRSFQGFGSGAASGINTGFRSNSNRSGTIPARDWVNYAACAKQLVERLSGVVIESRNAIEVINHHDGSDTLHYVDPPYTACTRSAHSKKTYRYEMSDAEHEELAEALNAVKGKVLISGYRSELYDSLYPGWLRFDRPSLADGARVRTESIWLNYEPAQSSMFNDYNEAKP